MSVQVAFVCDSCGVEVLAYELEGFDCYEGFNGRRFCYTCVGEMDVGRLLRMLGFKRIVTGGV